MLHLNRLVVAAGCIALFAEAGAAQTPDPTSWQSKLRYHAAYAYGPLGLTESALYASYLQETNSPEEWGQGAKGYGKRLGSELAYSGVRNILGFGLDSALHQDPHYYRSADSGFWRRTKHAIRSTILTRKDGGGETFATWRFGSAYGAAFISNEWYPSRLNTVSLGFQQGTAQIGFDIAANLGFEFWPDVRKKILHH